MNDNETGNMSNTCIAYIPIYKRLITDKVLTAKGLFVICKVRNAINYCIYKQVGHNINRVPEC